MRIKSATRAEFEKTILVDECDDISGPTCLPVLVFSYSALEGSQMGACITIGEQTPISKDALEKEMAMNHLDPPR